MQEYSQELSALYGRSNIGAATLPVQGLQQMAGKTDYSIQRDIGKTHVSGRNPGTGTAYRLPKDHPKEVSGNHIDTARPAVR